MVRVDQIEMNKQDMIDISTKFINGKCLKIRGAFLHMGKIILRYDRGSLRVAICDSLRIVGIELPFIVVDGNWHIAVAKVGQDFCRGLSFGGSFALAQVGKPVVFWPIDPLGQYIIRPARFLTKFIRGKVTIIWVGPTMVAYCMASISKRLKRRTRFCIDIPPYDETGRDDPVFSKG